MSTPAQPATQPAPAPAGEILRCEGLTKSFGNVRALRDVTLSAARGEITALVGDNGAGKSTLVRCIAGVHVPDSGHLAFDGRPVHFHNPEEARRGGIETVHQNLALVEDLTIWQNLFLNRELVRRLGPVGLLDRRRMQTEASQMMTRLVINVPSVKSRVRQLSGGQRQAVAISRATGWGRS